MSIERRNPLPAGRYWIDTFGDNRPAFADWSKSSGVKVVTTQSFDSDPPRDWFLFTVASPLPFDAVKFGFPTIAPPEVKSAEDTVQKPDLPKNALDDLDNTLSQIGKVAKLGLGILGLGLLLKYLGHGNKE